MKRLFFGTPKVYSVDEKGRVSVPASLRENLPNNHVFLAYAARHLIRCYPKDAYKRKTPEMLKRPEEDSERQMFFSAEEVEIDTKGRILIPGRMGGLDEVVFAANGDFFGIYDPKKLPEKYQTML